MDDLRKFALYFRPYKKSLVVGVLCILASTVAGLLIPVYVGRAVDELGTGPTWGRVTSLALFIVGASVVSGIFLFLQRRILIGMSRHVEYDLRQDFYAHLQRLPLDFFEGRRLGDVLSRLTGDIQAIESFVLSGVADALSYALRVAFFAGALLYLQWDLALVSLVVAPIFYVAARRTATLLKRASREKRRRSGSIPWRATSRAGAARKGIQSGRAPRTGSVRMSSTAINWRGSRTARVCRSSSPSRRAPCPC